MQLLKLARIIGIAGSLLVLGAGGKWVWDYQVAQREAAGMQVYEPHAAALVAQNSREMLVYRETGWVMLALGAVTLLSSVRLLKSPHFGGLVMIITAFTPTLQLRSALAITMPLLLAGIAAVFGLEHPEPSLKR